MIGKHIPGPPSGPIAIGVMSVIIEHQPAATVGGLVACTGPPGSFPHPGSMIAQGSKNVFIGAMPAARKGDKTTCGASVAEGAKTVFIGGGQAIYMAINPEVSVWVGWALMALGLVGGFGLLRAAGYTLAGAMARLSGATVGGWMGSWAGSAK